ncbi:hypothetical protein WJX79_001762 [Trebouxia sp. C0005]
MAMEAFTDTQRLQLTLQELIDFLGKTYVTTCEEVARTEYAVQSNMRIVQDLQAAVSQRNNVLAGQCDAPSLPASSQIGQMPTSSYPVHSAEAEEPFTPVAASAADLPAYFRKALNAFRRPSSQRQAQSAASATGAASSSSGSFINLTETYNASLASITHAGKAFQDAVTAAHTPWEQARQSWANPEAQSWLRHSALVQAQLLLMQRLTASLDAQQPGRHGNPASSSAHADQDTLQLWNEVQQEYHMLFETSAADPEAVTRWRNRALRFVLPSDSSAPDVVSEPAADQQSKGFAANKAAEAWLPEACWTANSVQAAASASAVSVAAPH